MVVCCTGSRAKFLTTISSTRARARARAAPMMPTTRTTKTMLLSALAATTAATTATTVSVSGIGSDDPITNAATCRVPSTSVESAAAAASSLVSSSITDTMPKIGLGTYLLDNPQQVVQDAILKFGYRRIDCAPVYFNEEQIGDALRTVLNTTNHTSHNNNGNGGGATTVITREDLFIVSKLAAPFHRREHVVTLGLQKTLQDLRVEYLDLYLIHWPVAFHLVELDMDPAVRGYTNEAIDDSRDGTAIDPSVSLWETWLGMEDAKAQGLVKHIGVSNVPIALLQELLSHHADMRYRPEVNQIELHPYLSQQPLVEYCAQHQIHVQAYSPLGTPGYKNEKEPTVLHDPTLQHIAANKRHTTRTTKNGGDNSSSSSSSITKSLSPAQVALHWALQRNTSVVCKASSTQHLQENMDVLHQFHNYNNNITNNNAQQQQQDKNHDDDNSVGTNTNTKSNSNVLGLLTPNEMNEIDKMNRNYRYFRPYDWWGKYAPVLD